MTVDQASRQPPRFTLPRSRRLKRTGDFRRIYALRASVADTYLVVYAARNDLGFSRLGVSVGRKLGDSVERNRLKRLLREAFRLSRRRLPAGYDFILIPRVGPDAALAGFLEALPDLARRAAQKADRKSDTRRRGGEGA